MQRRWIQLVMRSIEMSMLAVALIFAAAPAHGQSSNQFGGQSRADAASKMIVLSVQQGISSLPPTSGQSFTYDYNAELGSFVPSEELGPTVFRSAQSIGANKLSMRVAASYFELGETFGPIDYKLVPESDPQFPPELFAQFGTEAQANVTLLNFGATYGITDRIEVSVNVPVTVVRAQASQLYTVRPERLNLPPPDRPLGVATSEQGLQSALSSNPPGLVVAENTYTSLGFDFNSGRHAGVGRISVGGKGLLLASDLYELAFSTEFFCNSPNEAEFAGSNSPSILPRLIGTLKPAKRLRLHADAGYDYDFTDSQLTRFTWNTGISVPVVNATFDVGVGGSKFDSPIRWTPPDTVGLGPATPTHPDGIPTQVIAVNSDQTKLGTNFVDFLFGMKVKVYDGTVLSGSVNVPVTSDGFRADAVGTVALEYYF